MRATSAIRAVVAAAALRLAFAASHCTARAHHVHPAPAFVPPHPGVVRHRGTSLQLQLQLQLQLRLDEAAVDASAIEEAVPPPPPSAVDEPPPFQIREAAFDELGKAADLMTDGFYPNLQNNPILRPLRHLLELERLQGNFPYDDKDRHFYLAAYNGDGEMLGFCDLDGRIPKPNGGGFSLLSPFAPRVNRPQPYFSDLSVRPDHRRRGIASALMSAAEERARRMGFEELYLGVRSTNEEALQMYSRMGYELIVPYGDMLAFLEVQKDVRMLRRSLDPLGG
ncbi:hypothetical protein ACHAXT_007664 [Thalassiosira profunda]